MIKWRIAQNFQLDQNNFLQWCFKLNSIIINPYKIKARFKTNKQTQGWNGISINSEEELE